MATKKNIFRKVIYISISLVLVIIVIVKLKTNKDIAKQKVYQYNKEQAINIQADTVKLENINADYLYSGTFEPYKETKISAEIQGKINEVLVDLGIVVTKGQALIQLDNSLLKLQLQTIELQIEGLEADVNRFTILSKSSLDVTDITFFDSKAFDLPTNLTLFGSIHFLGNVFVLNSVYSFVSLKSGFLKKIPPHQAGSFIITNVHFSI